MNIRLFILCVLQFQNFNLSQAQQLHPFILEGSIEGKYSGYFYLNYTESSGRIIQDSCKVNKGDFIIKDSVLEPIRASFSILNYINPNNVHDEKNSATLYIEPSYMKLSVVINQFNNFKFTGSQTDSDWRQLIKLKMPLSILEQPVFETEQKYINQYRSEKKSGKDTQRLNILQKEIDSLTYILDPLYAKENLIDSVFIVQHPDSYLAVEMLWMDVQIKNIRFPSLENLFAGFSKRIQESYFGKKIFHEVEKEKNIVIGAYAKNFIAVDSKGDTISLADYKSKKYVLLDFGASWCAPCRKLIPDLKKEYAKYDTALEIISIANQDQVDEWRKAVTDDKAAWPQIIENLKIMPISPSSQTITDMYYIDLIPSLILIEKDSKIIGKYGGFYSSANTYIMNELTNKLYEIFGKK